MGIETTIDVKRTDAIRILGERYMDKIFKLQHMSNEELEQELYVQRDTIFENYNVINDEGE